jgi:hypothetical protein
MRARLNAMACFSFCQPNVGLLSRSGHFSEAPRMAGCGAQRKLALAVGCFRFCPHSGPSLDSQHTAAWMESGHSMTSSARARIDCGTARPSAFAVFRLITISNLVDCCTGSSIALAPFRSLSTKVAAWL